MTAAEAAPVESNVERVNRLQEEFRILHRLGLHLFPVGADKLPIGKWALGAVNYVETRATIAQGDKWATDPRVRGWANLCGARDVKVFTFDVEAAGMDYPQVTGVLDALPASCQRPSPNGGRHAVVQVAVGDPVPTEALAFGSGRLLVEVRGVGRDGNNGAYAVITGPGRGPLPRDFMPADLSRREVDRLLDMARTADDGSRPQKARKAKAPNVPRAPGGTRGGGTGEVLVEATRSGVLAWPELLDDGWTVTSDWQGRTGLRRPSYGEQTKAPDSGNVVDGVLVVHSESVPWAVVGEGYNAPQALAASRFGGDYAAAMKAVEDGSHGARPPFMAAWPERVLEAVRASKAADLAEWKRQKDREQAEWVAAQESILNGTTTRTGAVMGTTTGERALQVVPDLSASEESPTEGSEAPFVSTWQPLDLSAFLDGTHVPEEPTLAARTDGRCLFYAGRTHSLYGESESGKSLVVQSVAVDVMRAGGRVLYLDFESDGGSIVARLRSLGATVDEIRAGLHYVRPDASLTATGDLTAYAGVLDNVYDLAVLDGVSEAMALVMVDARGTPEESVSNFDRKLPGRIARRTGAAVVSIDHVTKSTESRGRNALGSGHKLAILTGAAFMVRALTLPGKGKRGVVELRVAKDRPAGLRPYCGPVGPHGAQEAARFVFDATGADGITRTVIEPPDLDGTNTGPFRPTALMERASRDLEDQSAPVSSAVLTANMGGRKDTALAAIRVLVEEGYVVTSKGPRGSNLHASARPYRQVDDPASDMFTRRP